MDRTLLIIYEPALFLLAGLGWAAWEFWSMRDKAPGKAEADPRLPLDPPAEG